MLFRFATRLAIVSIASLTLACRTAAPEVHDLDALFSDLNARGLFDGAVVVSDPRGIVFEKGYGLANVEHLAPFTSDTPADGGSLAKTFTAAILLALEADGILDLDDPAQKFLPELPYSEITLRHLLSHSSAIPIADYDWFDTRMPRDTIRTTEALLAVIAKERPPLATRPGTAFAYSSLGFDLAALAAARATGKQYGDLLAERFFRPLGITPAFARPARLSEFPPPRTTGYRREGGELVVNDVFDNEAFVGGSNLYVSARALDRWNRALLDGTALPPAPLEAAHAYATIGDAPSTLTLGSWYRTPDGNAYWYSGHLQGFHNEVFREVAKRRSIVYVSNNTIEPWLQKGIVRAVTAVLDGGPAGHLIAPATQEISAGERASLAGRWLLETRDVIAIENDAGRLMLVSNGVRYPIVQITRRAFYVPGVDHILGFARSREGGPVDRIHVSTNVSEAWGVRNQASK
jgi:CubicO group peptidase (beta-lactamase class C family)